MTEEVIEQAPGTDQIPSQESETSTENVQEQQGAADATENKEAETDDQKNARVQQEAAARQEKRARGVQKRMDELTREKYEERKRADELASQNARLLEAVLKGQGGTATGTAAQEGEPKPEQFTDYNDYVRALARYEAKQVSRSEVETTTRATQEATQRAAAEQAAVREAAVYAERARAAAKTLPDFEEVMEDASSITVPTSVLNMIRRMDDGPVIAYHMVKNPRLADQFNTASPDMHGILLGQISATIKGPAKVSNAPPPGKGVQAKPGSGTEPPADPDQYMAWAAKNMR